MKCERADSTVPAIWYGNELRPTATKETPPLFPVRVFQDKAPGGDLLRVATCGRHRSSDMQDATKTKASPIGEAF